ncbi:uncharacterized protein MELLADRAFT_94561 [Melampsora larici-populina 98AG31]|uniref:Uncharacterized protein n=1 Tax=Melampsora larici-populina (strain 98AG31 / pathotype 3-4-7) TaxID=747676 RepID=F4RBV7_MELLP|nr:uncharacterized protein MELLADRAFT_94561 [Melampsora larici-populina 98AG31]EGG10275.1 hypothetical protein MELLADRAFT_94561 [Melampsora larici-populina 98AG31]
MVSTRRNPVSDGASHSTGVLTQSKSNAKTKRSKSKKKTKTKNGDGQNVTEGDDQNIIPDRQTEEEDQGQTITQNKSSQPSIFRSRFPGLEMETFEDHLDDWTLVELRQHIAKQGSKSSRPHQEIRTLVKSICLEYEKRMLMAALMGGVPEIVIWNLVVLKRPYTCQPIGEKERGRGMQIPGFDF